MRGAASAARARRERADRAPAWSPGACVLLVAPFYLNDLANIFVADWRLWLAIDYVGVKLVPGAVAWWLVHSRRMRPAELGLAAPGIGRFALVFVATALAGTLLDQNGYRWLRGLPGYPALGAMPAIASPAWNRIDLTAGLLAVGVVEELVFRGYALAVLRRVTTSPAAVVALSSVAFGLIHWSAGWHAVVVTSLIGAVFMLAYLRARALPAIMLAHFAIDFIDLAGVVPRAIFRLP